MTAVSAGQRAQGEEPLRVALHGAAGRMGQAIVRLVADRDDLRLVAAFDRDGSDTMGRDVGELAGVGTLGVGLEPASAARFDRAAVIVDFSEPTALSALLDACRDSAIPIVSGTTGLSAEAERTLQQRAKTAPVIHAPNMSVGVTVLFHLAARAAALLGEDFDAEIVEMHHGRKIDAPSGTARRLLEVVADAKGFDADGAAVYGREGDVGARGRREIGVMSLRGGDVVGDHSLILAGAGERVELSHRAHERAIFARGALRAARWIVARPPGRYDMTHVLGLL